MSDAIQRLRNALELASAQIHEAYWAACDAMQSAVAPGDVTDDPSIIDMLSEQYDIALRIEEDPLGWSEGRAKW